VINIISVVLHVIKLELLFQIDSGADVIRTFKLTKWVSDFLFPKAGLII